MLNRFYIFVFAIMLMHFAGHTQNIAVEAVSPFLMVKAKLVDRTSGLPIAGKRAYVTVPGPVFEMRTAVSDQSGNLTFLLKHPEGSKQFIFQVNHVTDSSIALEFNDPLAEEFKSGKYPKPIREVGDTLPFFGKADKQYLLDDYVRFPTMEEVLREFVAEVRVRRARDGLQLQVLNTPYQNIFFDSEPLVLLDGVPVFETDALMKVDPLKIRLIQVVSRRFYSGSLVCNGIVSFSSYNGDLAGYELPRQAQVRDYNHQASIK